MTRQVLTILILIPEFTPYCLVSHDDIVTCTSLPPASLTSSVVHRDDRPQYNDHVTPLTLNSDPSIQCIKYPQVSIPNVHVPLTQTLYPQREDQLNSSSTVPSRRVDYDTLGRTETLMDTTDSHCAVFTSVTDTIPFQSRVAPWTFSSTGSVAPEHHESPHLNHNGFLTEPTSNCLPLLEMDTSTAATKQPEHSECDILNTGYSDDISSTHMIHNDTPSEGQVSVNMFAHISHSSDVSTCISTTSLSKPTSSDSHKPIWKEVMDPATGRILYVHSKSGNCVSSLPHELSVAKEVDSFVSLFNKDHLHGSIDGSVEDSLPSTDCSSLSALIDCHTEISNHPQISACFGAELPGGAPNPYYDFEKFIPRPTSKRQRISSLSKPCGSCIPITAANSSMSMSSLLANHQSQTQLSDSKWRHQSELNKIASVHGSETAVGLSFTDIFKEWKNPAFQGGEEVSRLD